MGVGQPANFQDYHRDSGLTLYPRLLYLSALLAMGVATAASPPAEVHLRNSGAGQFLTDARGMTLYTYAQDSAPGKSACIAECAKNWPPLRAAASTSTAADWSLIERDDGARQWAWRGHPLYNYAKDSEPGTMLGDGVGNAWRVALDKIALPPGFSIRSIYLGRILADARGRSLYWRSTESSNDDQELAPSWSPVYAPWLAQPRGDWTVLARRDGQKQWAFRGHRLFANADDLKPGDTAGLHKDWQVAVLDAAPDLPSWVTLQNSDMGEVFADERGHTLYTLVGQLDKIRQFTCKDDCVRRNWRTLPAAANTKPSGDWTTVASPLDEAGLVWAYKGNALYVHLRDREPGAIGGDKWAVGAGNTGGAWQPLLRRRDFDE